MSFIWQVPRGIDLGFIEPRFYSLLFALGFVVGYFIMKRIFLDEKIPLDWLDHLLTYVAIATVIGARLGHVFFYQWDYYKDNILEIFMVWEGGLASHGAAIAIILALVIYSRKVSKRSVFWILDRVVITVALAGCFIRMGNMMNSEIYGDIGNSSIETVFVEPAKATLESVFSEASHKIKFTKTNKTFDADTLIFPVLTLRMDLNKDINGQQVVQMLEGNVRRYLNNRDRDDLNIIIPADAEAQWIQQSGNNYIEMEVYGVPRLPSQVIEALAYLLTFLILFLLFKKTSIKQREGFIFGLFLIMIFGFRFVVEYFKANQVAFEDQLTLNMGQYLSIPLVIGGLIMLIISKNNYSNESKKS